MISFESSSQKNACVGRSTSCCCQPLNLVNYNSLAHPHNIAQIIDFGLGSFDEGYALIPNDHHAVATLVSFLAQRRAPERSDSVAYQVGSSLTSNISAMLSALPSTGSQMVLGISSSFIHRGSGEPGRKPSRVCVGAWGGGSENTQTSGVDVLFANCRVDRC